MINNLNPMPDDEPIKKADMQSGEIPPEFIDAERFLTALGAKDFHTFQSLPEGAEEKRGINRTIHGTLLRQQETLSNLNKGGAGIFVMVNLGDGEGRASANVRKVRALFVDLDGAELQPVLDAPIPPSITIESSPGRFHAYWLVNDMPLNEFKAAQQALAKMFNGDKSVCDLPRLMRLPGFLHNKSTTPFRSRILSYEPDRRWNWDELSEGLGISGKLKLPCKIPQGERNITLFNLAASGALSGMPKEERLASLLKINIERCEPPLGEKEVRTLVDSAYRNPPAEAMKVPIALLADKGFLSVGSGAKLLMILTYQKLVRKPKNSQIPMLWKDYKQHFPRENTFKAYRKELVKKKLILRTKRAKRPTLSKTDWNLFKLRITSGL